MLKYESVSELVQAAAARGTKISEVVIEDQAEAMECSRMELYEKMEIDLHVMWEAAKAGAEKGQRSMSGLTGGEGYRMHEYIQEKKGGLCGPVLGKAMAKPCPWRGATRPWAGLWQRRQPAAAGSCRGAC